MNAQLEDPDALAGDAVFAFIREARQRQALEPPEVTILRPRKSKPTTGSAFATSSAGKRLSLTAAAAGSPDVPDAETLPWSPNSIHSYPSQSIDPQRLVQLQSSSAAGATPTSARGDAAATTNQLETSTSQPRPPTSSRTPSGAPKRAASLDSLGSGLQLERQLINLANSSSDDDGHHGEAAEPLPRPPRVRRRPAGLNQLEATAICGNDITASCFYVVGQLCKDSGVYAPLCTAFTAFVLYCYRKVYGEVVSALPLNGGLYNVCWDQLVKSPQLCWTGSGTPAACSCQQIFFFAALFPCFHVVLSSSFI